VADPLAFWGAITGTVATIISVRREFVLNRTRLGVQHGVHFLVRPDSQSVQDAWLTIRVWNDGGRPLTVERVGVKYFPTWVEGQGLHINAAGGLAEIDLQGVPVELAPGGPSRKLYAPLRGLLQAGIEVLKEPVYSWARTSEGNEWEGGIHPVVPDRVADHFRQPFEKLQEQLGVGVDAQLGGAGGAPPPVYVLLPNEGPPTEAGIEA
jgi:hypothetical protein